MSRRASLPGADELFRRTTPERAGERPAPAVHQQEDKSPSLLIAEGREGPSTAAGRKPKHEEKVTFYCTAEDLMSLERARLKLRGEHGIAADRGRIVRAAVAYVLEDFDARADDSILLRRLGER